MKNVLNNREVSRAVREKILTLVARKSTWEGTMTDLSAAISGRSNMENWPGSPSVLRRVVDRVVRSLRKNGVRVQFSRTSDKARRRIVKFSRRAA